MSPVEEVRRARLHYLVLALPFVGLALLAVLRFATTPDARGYGTHEQFGFAPCRFREWFDGPCPTCGVTTSVSYIVRGEVVASWRAQPFGTIVVLATIVGAVGAVVAHRRGGDLGELAMRRGGAFWAAVVVVLGVCWLV